ncbi:MAG: GGDEF domain-containing protein [Rhizobiaceae bacterium]|nr:GGDEF domain-containing protein [Rhizobiaceae bacterium]
MDNGIFISLVNPAIALTLTAAFLVLWFYVRPRPYLVMVAAAYAASAFGFIFQYVVLPFGPAPTKLLSSVFFMTAVVGIAAAVIARFGRPIPWWPLGSVAAAGLAGFSWFMFVQPDIAWRVLVFNFALGAICLVVAGQARTFHREGRLARAFFVLGVLSGLNFFVRPPITMALSEPFSNYTDLHTSLYWTTALFSHSVLSLIIALCLFTDEALAMMRTLRSETLTDPLSGLLNRRGFETKASELLESCKASNLPVSLVVADLDRFKSLNDRHGHAAGDRVIVEFATRLKDAAGMRAVAARIGGEEFAVLLPMADPAAARLFAEAVRTVFSGNSIDGLPHDLRVTGSFGIASLSGHEDLSQLLQRADAALYHAKRDGRDGVRVSYQRKPEPPPAESGQQVA